MAAESSGGSVLVVGSANMDMVVTCDQFPQPGETILAKEFAMYPGGKGANQAVACARLGGDVELIARVGNDVFRDRLRTSLSDDGVRIGHMREDPSGSTGIALITVDGSGQNEIVVVAGANMRLTPDEIDRDAELFKQASVIMLQLEIPLESVVRAAELGQEAGATVILNPAPAAELPDSLLRHVDYLTPNETECERLTGIAVTDAASAERAARRLLERGVGAVIVTRGEHGALLVTCESTQHFPAVPASVVDTTGAGDAFNGALAFGLAGGLPLDDTLVLANAVASYSVTKKGAQSSMPTWADLPLNRLGLDGTIVEIATNAGANNHMHS